MNPEDQFGLRDAAPTPALVPANFIPSLALKGGLLSVPRVECQRTDSQTINRAGTPPGLKRAHVHRNDLTRKGGHNARAPAPADSRESIVSPRASSVRNLHRPIVPGAAVKDAPGRRRASVAMHPLLISKARNVRDSIATASKLPSKDHASTVSNIFAWTVVVRSRLNPITVERPARTTRNVLNPGYGLAASIRLAQANRGEAAVLISEACVQAGAADPVPSRAANPAGQARVEVETSSAISSNRDRAEPWRARFVPVIPDPFPASVFQIERNPHGQLIQP